MHAGSGSTLGDLHQAGPVDRSVVLDDEEKSRPGDARARATRHPVGDESFYRGDERVSDSSTRGQQLRRNRRMCRHRVRQPLEPRPPVGTTASDARCDDEVRGRVESGELKHERARRRSALLT